MFFLCKTIIAAYQFTVYGFAYVWSQPKKIVVVVVVVIGVVVVVVHVVVIVIPVVDTRNKPLRFCCNQVINR